MAIKLIEIIPASGPLGTKIINLEDTPGGLSFNREHLRPLFPRRTQNGTLVSQTLIYNKKQFTLTGVIYEITLHTYLESLYESAINATLKTWYEATTTYTETTGFNGTVLLTSYADTHDKVANIRNFTAIFSEV